MADEDGSFHKAKGLSLGSRGPHRGTKRCIDACIEERSLEFTTDRYKIGVNVGGIMILEGLNPWLECVRFSIFIG